MRKLKPNLLDQIELDWNLTMLIDLIYFDIFMMDIAIFGNALEP